MEDETDCIVKRAHIAKGDTPGKSNPKYGRVTEDESGNKPLPQRRRSLFKNEDVLPTETLVAHSVKAANWKNEELEAIVQYIALYKPSLTMTIGQQLEMVHSGNNVQKLYISTLANHCGQVPCILFIE